MRRVVGTRPVVVLGASGRTGALVVANAAARGTRTLAVVRRADQSSAFVATGVEVLVLDPSDGRALAAATPRDATFISCVAFSADGSETPQTDVAMAAAYAVSDHGAGRVVAISATGAFSDTDAAPMRAVKGVLGRFFSKPYADTRTLEAAMSTADVEAICVRPPRLTNGTARGYRSNVKRDVPGGGSISRADLATALVDIALGEATDPVVRVASGSR